MTMLRAPAYSADLGPKARRWLLGSGVRSTATPGAVHRAFDARRRILLPPYPEITAYSVQFHLRWKGNSSSEDFAAACESGEWLISVQDRDSSGAAGAFPYAVDSGTARGGYYTFDTAIAGHALLDLYCATGKQRYGEAAQRAARRVLAWQRPDGGFAAGVGEIRPESWAAGGNCLHGKLAVFFGRLWRETGEAEYCMAARRLLRWLVALQRRDGGIVTASGSNYVFLHAHCYAMEGLLAGAILLDEPQYLEHAARGAHFIATVQRADGGVPRHVGTGAKRYLAASGARLPFVRMLAAPTDTGATAQAVRIWSWMRALGELRFARHLDRGLAWLASCQLRSPDACLDGAFPAGIDPLRPWQRAEMLLYPWVTMFAADAVRLQAAVNIAEDLY